MHGELRPGETHRARLINDHERAVRQRIEERRHLRQEVRRQWAIAKGRHIAVRQCRPVPLPLRDHLRSQIVQINLTQRGDDSGRAPRRQFNRRDDRD
ncbi:MAG: hypothetical protein ABI145_21600, partial [Steroidobacteraceae bacterium]